jgi:hypothetical protein
MSGFDRKKKRLVSADLTCARVKKKKRRLISADLTCTRVKKKKE